MEKPSPKPHAGHQSAPPAFVLRLLGGFELRDRAGKQLRLRTRKARLLLALLAHPVGRAHSRSSLAAMLWGDRAETQARGSLRNALSEIRAALGPTSVRADAEEIGLDPSALTTDCEALERAAEDDGAGRGAALAELYPGEFLQGVEHDGGAFGAWVDEQRSRFRDLAGRYLRAEIARLEDEARRDDATERARELLSLDPLSEESHRILMRLYAAAGERSLALAQFRNCSALVQRELGVEPSGETQDLAASIARPGIRAPSDAVVALATVAHPPASRPSAVLDAEETSVAIIPFTNLSADAGQDFFSVGISEDIATDLARLSRISVIVPASFGADRATPASPLRIATEFGARYILDGSVRRQDSDVRITARLVEAENGRQVWAERYDRKLVNIFGLQQEIAGQIVAALNVGFVPASASSPAGRRPRDIEAYQLYLRGRAFLREMTMHSVQMSREMFSRAIQLDPDYAEAHAGLAESVCMLAFHYIDEPDILDAALASSERALRINPQLAEAHAAKGQVLSQLGQPEAAEAALLKAIELNPHLHQAHLYLGLMRLTSGHAREALPLLRAAAALAPEDLQTLMMLSVAFRGTGDMDELRTTARRKLAVAQRRLESNPYDDRAAYVGACALVDLGRMEEASEWLDMATSFETDDPRTLYNLACGYSNLGDIDKSLDLLGRAMARKHSLQKEAWARDVDPDLANARSDPRFRALFDSGKVAESQRHAAAQPRKRGERAPERHPNGSG